MGLVRRYIILVAVGTLLAGCLSASTFFYVYLPSEQAFSPSQLGSGKVVGKTSAALFFGQFGTVTVWDFGTGRVEEYFVPAKEYVRLSQGEVIAFRHRGHFIVALEKLEKID